MWLLCLPIPLLFVITMAACLASQIVKNSFTYRYGSAFDKYVFISLGALVTVITLILLAKIDCVSLYTALMACAFGVLCLLQSFFMLKAFEYGSFAYTTVIASLSTIIPALSGAIFFGETISLVQIIGICLMIACFFLCVNYDKKQENSEKNESSNKRQINAADKQNHKNKTLKWLIYVGITFLTTGGIGVMQKVHQSSPYKAELNAFLVISFGVCMIVSAVMAFKNRNARFEVTDCNSENSKGEKSALTGTAIKKRGVSYYIIIVLSGLSVAFNNFINLYLSGKVDSAIFFPLVNGGGLVLVTLCALIIYKEKLTLKQWIGIVVGVISVILLGNPF